MFQSHQPFLILWKLNFYIAKDLTFYLPRDIKGKNHFPRSFSALLGSWNRPSSVVLYQMCTQLGVSIMIKHKIPFWASITQYVRLYICGFDLKEQEIHLQSQHLLNYKCKSNRILKVSSVLDFHVIRRFQPGGGPNSSFNYDFTCQFPFLTWALLNLV